MADWSRWGEECGRGPHRYDERSTRTPGDRGGDGARPWLRLDRMVRYGP